LNGFIKGYSSFSYRNSHIAEYRDDNTGLKPNHGSQHRFCKKWKVALSSNFAQIFMRIQMNKLTRIAFATLFLSCAGFTIAQSDEYDAGLAAELGADDYGMKAYVMVILSTGDTEIEDKAERDQVFAGHFSNMSKLAEEQKLVVAGPFSNAQPKRGLFILNVDNIEAAEAIVKTDPAVAAGIFNYDLSLLYSSAALMLVNENHKKLQKKAM
jgi:uncharacterized protein YciI